MIELLQKSLKQPEPNPDLFHFVEDAFYIWIEAKKLLWPIIRSSLRFNYLDFMGFALVIHIQRQTIY
jgi:hypothetical protein